MSTFKLVDEKSGNELHIGDKVKTFRGESAILLGFTPPRHGGSTGRVSVKIGAEREQEFFPGVICAKIVQISAGKQYPASISSSSA